MIGPLAFSFFTLVHAGIAIGALLLIEYSPVAALCLFVVEAVTVFDNGVTVLGNQIGIGPAAERLNRLRFLFHAVCIGLLIPVYAAIVIVTALPAAATPINAVAWLFAAGISFFGYFRQYSQTGPIMPVNYFGCLRYAQSVSDLTRRADYDYSAAELAARGGLPMASVLTTLIGLIIAVLIGWFGGFWVPFVVTALMFLAGALPLRSWGPLATSCLEIVYSGGILYSLAFAFDALG